MHTFCFKNRFPKDLVMLGVDDEKRWECGFKAD